MREKIIWLKKTFQLNPISYNIMILMKTCCLVANSFFFFVFLNNLWSTDDGIHLHHVTSHTRSVDPKGTTKSMTETAINCICF